MINIKFFLMQLYFVLISLSIYGQFNFDSINICHSKQKELQHISAGQYDLEIQKGRLHSFMSKDRYVKYDEPNRLFILKHLDEPDSIKIQLSKSGVVFSNTDTTITVNKLSAFNPSLSNPAGDANIFCQLGSIGFWIYFHNDKLFKIMCPFSNKALTVNIDEYRGTYESWDFLIEGSGKRKNVLLMDYASDLPWFITIEDHANKVGMRLFSSKRNGVYDSLTGLKMVEKGKFGSDASYLLKYTQGGKLKKNSGSFNLSCEY